jgi:hypothetical protein
MAGRSIGERLPWARTEETVILHRDHRPTRIDGHFNGCGIHHILNVHDIRMIQSRLELSQSRRRIDPARKSFDADEVKVAEIRHPAVVATKTDNDPVTRTPHIVHHLGKVLIGAPSIAQPVREIEQPHSVF